ncbi:riboflavin synthase domain-like protein [Neolentinus lepideus HHB14362 ss-1]|uniref:NADPH-dependent diflavin oxidoreductase 1 n=1 Tax=Neolentinus lepideus HHB14362 ss-1 TaxID=1314782 RepID=A0A165SF40_9AGAM|nr:riboflavin synthase domain-like protein [Neolentinus lepideus HHB14362 ss-1]
MDHDVLVLYATETGTAQDAADRAARHVRRLRCRARVVSVDAYPLADLVHEQLCLFLLSTSGSGAFPRSAEALWSTLLRSDLPPDLFDDLDFAVFGLGDSAYEKFCWPAKLLDRRLEALGGRALVQRGEGDDQHPLGVDGALLPWLDALTNVLAEHFPVQPTSGNDRPPPRVTLVPAPPSVPVPADPRLADPRYHWATLRVNRRITAPDWWQDVRHFEFDFDEDVQFDPGATASLLPVNPPDAVAAFLDALGWTERADDPVFVCPNLGDQTLPPFLPPPTEPTSLRHLLAHHLSIQAVPRRAFWETLVHWLEGDEREKVEEWLGEEGGDDLAAYTTRPRRTALECVAEFRSRGKIPPAYAFDLVPGMREREFSIAGSARTHPRQLHLCVAIVKYRTRLIRAPRRGVATAWLAGMEAGTRILAGIHPPRRALPPPATPLVLVGPGTGVASMRAVVEERAGAGEGETTLYFGCRSAAKDQHYAEEWREYEREGRLRYRLAASRDGEATRVGVVQSGEADGAPPKSGKTYVQDLIAQDGPQVWDALRRGGVVFISGSSNKMPAAVRAALRGIVASQGGFGEEEAREWVERAEREGRIIEECWS